MTQSNNYLQQLVDDVTGHDRRALAKALSIVESSKACDQATSTLLMKALEAHGHAHVIGFAGAPGVGKSSFLNVLCQLIIQAKHTVAILTVDPSSQRSGGSLMADLTRMPDLTGKPEVFIRTTPSSGFLGGIAPSTQKAIKVCDAAGYDYVIVETVGGGQSEFELAHWVDLFFYALTPGSGDDLQGMKRGVLEWVDGILVTQADQGREKLAQKSMHTYRQGLNLCRPPGQPDLIAQAISIYDLKTIETFWRSVQGRLNTIADVHNYRSIRRAAGFQQAWRTGLIQHFESQQVFRHWLEKAESQFVTKSQSMDELIDDFLSTHISTECFQRLFDQGASHQQERRNRDLLTGLLGRNAFQECLQKSLEQTAADEQSHTPTEPMQASSHYTLIAIDIQRFHQVNTVFGLNVGDQVLCLVADRLQNYCKPMDIIARIGGDEFYLLIDMQSGDTHEFVNKMLNILQQPVCVFHQNIGVLDFSVASVELDDHSTCALEAMRQASATLFITKQNHQESYLVFKKDLAGNLNVKENLQSYWRDQELKRAALKDEFSYLVQPLYNTQTQQIFGGELLLRWDHPERGIVPAMDFVDAAELLGILQQSDLSLIFRQGREILDIARRYNVIFHLNLTAQVFINSPLMSFLDEMHQQGLLDVCHFEITEHSLIERFDLAEEFITKVKACGSQVWLDDFGVGYGGLKYLDVLPFDGIKIDQSFAKNHERPKTKQLLAGMIQMAKSLDVEVLIEGVENQTSAQSLSDIGCHLQQGNFYGEALLLKDFENLLVQQTQSANLKL